MHLKNTIKNMIRSPFLYLLFFLLLTLSVTFFSLGFITYMKGEGEQDNIRSAYKLLGVLDGKDNSILNVNVIKNDISNSIINSKYIDRSSTLIQLAATLPDRIRMPFQNDSRELEYHLYILGNVVDYTKDSSGNYNLNVLIDTVLHGKKSTGDVVKIYLGKDLHVDYDKLLTGTPFYYGLYPYRGGQYSLVSDFDYITEGNTNITLKEAMKVEENRAFFNNFSTFINTMNRFPLYFTNGLEDTYNFSNKKASIIEGRSFTSDEYESWSNVCIIHDEIARKFNLKLGDSLDISEIDNSVYFMNNTMLPYNPDNIIMSAGNSNFNPYEDFLKKDIEIYKIVGIYRSSIRDISDDYYIDSNTIYVPYPKNYNVENIIKYTNSFSFVLESPADKDAFIHELMEETAMNESYHLMIFDDGYSFIDSILKATKEGGLWILILTSITLLTLLFAFTYFYNRHKKREYAITRIIGESKWKASFMLIEGLLILAIPSLLSAWLISYRLSSYFLTRTYEMGVNKAISSGLMEGRFSKAYEFNSQVSMNQMILPFLIVFLLISLYGIVMCTINIRRPLISVINDKSK